MIDLHLHLDGSLSLKTLTSLCKMQGINPSEINKHRISVDSSCTSLNDYLECFAFPNTLLQRKEAISFAVTSLCQELAEQGLVYAEIRFAPQLSTHKGLSQEEVVKAAIEGLEKSQNHIEANLILCLMRGADESKNKKTIEVARKYLGKGVVAVDLAGAEALFPTFLYANLFTYAHEQEIPFTIHAGEAGGANEVKTAIDLGASRIGHGVNSIHDEALLKELKQKQIPLELCPTSEVDTHCIPSYDALPLRQLINKGILVTINTDDMTVSNITLKEEYKKLMDAFNLTEQEKLFLMLNGVEASFAKDKESLRKRIIKNVRNW